MNDLPVPTFDDVLAARERIRLHLRETPLYRYGGLDRRLGCQVYVKHENHQPVGAFKVRGGINLVSQLTEEERQRGLITASTGNHGQSIAYACRLFGVRVRICVPENCNPVKRAAMLDLGAELIEHGADFDAARMHCEALASEHGYRYVHSGDEPHLIAGVGTIALEIMERVDNLDVLFVPIGGGSGAAGACIVAKALRPEVRVIGVQAEAAPAAYESWKQRRFVEAPCTTFAEGLATRTPFCLPQKIIQEHLDDFILVSEEQLRKAVVICIEDVHNLVEGAGAASIAGALKLRDQLAGKTVAVVLSGGNLSPQQLRDILCR